MLVLGVRFKKAGKIYYFEPLNEKCERGEAVIVETARGIEYGTVELPQKDVPEDELVLPLKKVIRVATEEDRAAFEANKEKEKEAFNICLEKIAKHKLDMKLVDAEITFDGNKIIFYFTSGGRVDFRELVKDLASVFRVRIELRQIGVRDEAKMLNGIGVCGRTLCCATFLSDFHPVSIKMAKDQGLSLNPSKISGVCGRLMCCLQYEQEAYEHLIKALPKEGDIISTPEGDGEVLSVNVLKQTIKAAVRPDPKQEVHVSYFAPDEVKIIKRKRKGKTEEISKEDLKDIMD